MDAIIYTSSSLSVEAFVWTKIVRALATFFGKGSLSTLGSFQSWTSYQLHMLFCTSN
jgi:hypothetical protein